MVADVGAYLIVLVGDYADTPALVQTCREVIDHQAVDPCADESDDDQAERIDGEGGAADDHSGDGDRHSYIEMQILVDYLGKYVKASGRGIYAKHYCL